MANKSVAWTHIPGSLTIFLDGQKYQVDGALADELARRLVPHGKSIPESVLRSITNRMKDGGVYTGPKIGYSGTELVVARATDKEIVASMKSAGVVGIDTNASEEVTLDGQPINGAVARHLARIVERHNGDVASVNWKPVGSFFNRMQVNPVSTDHLLSWLATKDFSITSDGLIVTYRGVSREYASGHAGMGAWETADGVKHFDPQEDPEGYARHKSLLYAPGSRVYMNRNDCDPNGRNSCSYGLHFGTRQFANSYARNGHMMMCVVSPENVVSVPTYDAEKARCCELYSVASVTGDLLDSPVVSVSGHGATAELVDVTTPDEIALTQNKEN